MSESLEDRLKKLKRETNIEKLTEELARLSSLVERTVQENKELKREKIQNSYRKGIADAENRLTYLMNCYEEWHDSLTEELQLDYYPCCIKLMNKFRMIIRQERDELKAQEEILPRLGGGSESELNRFLSNIKEREEMYKRLKHIYRENPFSLKHNDHTTIFGKPWNHDHRNTEKLNKLLE